MTEVASNDSDYINFPFYPHKVLTTPMQFAQACHQIHPRLRCRNKSAPWWTGFCNIEDQCGKIREHCPYVCLQHILGVLYDVQKWVMFIEVNKIIIKKKPNGLCITLCLPPLQVQVFGSFSTGLYLPTRWVASLNKLRYFNTCSLVLPLSSCD